MDSRVKGKLEDALAQNAAENGQCLSLRVLLNKEGMEGTESSLSMGKRLSCPSGGEIQRGKGLKKAKRGEQGRERRGGEKEIFPSKPCP